MKNLVFEKEEHLDAYVGEYICHFIRNHSQQLLGCNRINTTWSLSLFYRQLSGSKSKFSSGQSIQFR